MKSTVDDEEMTFFDPSDDLSEKARFGKAFHLTINCDFVETARGEDHLFIRDASINQQLQEMTLEEPHGCMPSPSAFDTHACAVCAVH
jgi:hypothetical protein